MPKDSLLNSFNVKKINNTVTNDTLSVSTLISTAPNFKNRIIIDIRSRLAYLAEHIANSINLTTKDEIINFISNNPHEEYILCCNSSIRARNLASDINLPNVKFYNGNLLDAKEEGACFVCNDERFNNILKETRSQIAKIYKKYKRAYIIAFSGGKDSTCVLQLVYEMMLNLPKDELNPTYAILSDTLVEAPNVAIYFKNIVNSINSDAAKREIPFKIIIAKPSDQDEFWANLIGKGYPSPTRTFRWCTERLKINPMKSIAKEITDKHGSAIMLLGVRKSESINRKISIEKRILSEDGFSKHDDYENVLIYSPIKEWLTEDVWSYLTIQNPPPWDVSHNFLFDLYTQASGDECQFIIDKKQSSCGGSRFGCWVCTLVNEDKSMQGFIKSGEEKLRPLNEFRNFIKQAREDDSMRSDFKKDGSFRRGPFTSNARKVILKKLLECESKFGGELISDAQLKLISDIWKKEFDSENSCIKIAKEFNRMQNEDTQEIYLDDLDLIDETKNGGIVAKRIIAEVISKPGIKDREIYNIIFKNITDETAKLKDKNDFL
jgi:putative sulfurtransferase dndC